MHHKETRTRKLSGTRNAISKKTRNSNIEQVYISETNSFVSRSLYMSKIDQGTHHQVDICYGTTAGIQCLCISLMVACWSLIKSMSRWDSNYLDWILRKGDELFKSLSKFRLLGVEDLPTKMEIYSHSINIALL